MERLLKAFIKTGSATIVTILFGIFSTKIIAVIAGPSGTGYYSLLRNALQTFVGLATMQGSNAIIQGLSSRGDESQKRFKATVASIYCLLSVCICMSVWVFAAQLAHILLSQADLNAKWIIRGLIPTILFSTGASYCSSVLNGYRAIGRLAMVQVIGSASAALMAYPFVAMFHIMWGLTFLQWITSGTGFVSCLLFLWRGGWLENIRTRSYKDFDIQAARDFLKYAGVTILTGLASTVCLLVVRIMFVQHRGLSGAGIFDMSWTLSSTYIMIVLSALGTYYMPVLTLSKSDVEKSLFISQVFRIMTILAVPLITFMILGKSLVVELLYTPKFYPALGITEWMLIGDYFKATAWVLAMPVLSFAEMKVFFFTEMAWNLGLVAGTWFTLNVTKDSSGFGITFLLLYVVYLVFFYGYARKRHGLVFPGKIIWDWLLGLLIIVASSVWTWGEYRIVWSKIIVITFVLVFYLFQGITLEERRRILGYIKKRPA